MHPMLFFLVGFILLMAIGPGLMAVKESWMSDSLKPYAVMHFS